MLGRGDFDGNGAISHLRPGREGQGAAAAEGGRLGLTPVGGGGVGIHGGGRGWSGGYSRCSGGGVWMSWWAGGVREVAKGSVWIKG